MKDAKKNKDVQFSIKITRSSSLPYSSVQIADRAIPDSANHMTLSYTMHITYGIVYVFQLKLLNNVLISHIVYPNNNANKQISTFNLFLVRKLSLREFKLNISNYL